MAGAGQIGRSEGRRRGRWLPVLVVAALVGWAALALAREADGSGEPEVSRRVAPMVVLGLIMLATYLAIALGLLHKALAAILGAIAIVVAELVFRLLGPHGYAAVHEHLAGDLPVLGVIVGTSILVETVGRSGLFHWIAIKIVKRTEGDPRRLFLYVSLLTFFFVSLLTVAPATLLMVSLVLVIARQLRYDPRPYLVAVALLANSGALSTFASGIPTLMIGTAADLPYLHFFIGSLPVALLSALVAYAVLRRAYRKDLAEAAEEDPESRRRTVAGFDEWAMVRDRAIFTRSALLLAATIVGFAAAQSLGVGLDFIAMTGGACALLFCGGDVESAVSKVNWTVILFFVGLFVVVAGVKETGLLTVAADAVVRVCQGNLTVTILVVVAFVMLASGFVDNIPVAATMIPIARTMIESFRQQGVRAAEAIWWGLVSATNLGGNATPIGAISAVIALHALEKETGRKVGWGEYMKVALVVLALQYLLVCAFVLGMARFDLFPHLPGGTP